jgi:hypothetical protein
VFVTSRTFNPDISTAFEKDRQIQIHPPAQDMQAFLSYCLQCNPKLRRDFTVHDESPDSVFNRIIAKSRGMFLLADLLLQRELGILKVKEEEGHDGQDGSRPLQQETVVHNPEAILERYDNIFLQQGPVECDIASTTVSWMLYAKDTLRYSDMVQILMLLPWSDSISDALKTLSEQTMVDMCQGLIQIKGDSGELHFTEGVFAYLSSRDKMHPKQREEMANCCLDYLSLDAIIASDQQPVEDHGKIPLPPNQYAFKEYAKKYWGVHVLECDDPDLEQRAIEYLKKSLKSPARWTELHSTWFGRERALV